MRCERLLVLLVVALVLSGCNRLTFIKPNPNIKGFERTAPEYDFKDSRAASGTTLARQLLRSAETALNAGNAAEAETHARRAVKADPRLADAQLVLAMTLAAQNKQREAGAAYAAATALAPANGNVANNHGVWLCQQGQAAQSLGYFDRALADPQYATPVYAVVNKGSCALKAGQLDMAEASMRTVLQVEPANVLALETLSEVAYRQGRFLEARAFSERRLAAAAPARDVLERAVRIETRLGDAAAAARYTRQLDSLPMPPPASPGTR